jgi:TolA-binding protein
MSRAVAAAVLALLLISMSARAALFDDEEARKRIEATNQRLAQVQKQFDERIAALESQLKSQGLVELFNQVELLKSEAARLRGQIEVLSYELTEAQKRQQDLYVDLDSRMRRMETPPAPPPVAAANPGQAAPLPAPLPTQPTPTVAAPAPAFGPPSGVPPPTAGPTTIIVPGRSVPVPVPGEAGAEQRAYDAALDLFKSGNYGGAIAGFAAFVKTYPRSPLAPSAQY